ncbi:MAG: hypothetical protein HRF45_09630 [Fimbriimonadia bacterium]|jgi:hypothetical protein
MNGKSAKEHEPIEAYEPGPPWLPGFIQGPFLYLSIYQEGAEKRLLSCMEEVLLQHGWREPPLEPPPPVPREEWETSLYWCRGPIPGAGTVRGALESAGTLSPDLYPDPDLVRFWVSAENHHIASSFPQDRDAVARALSVSRYMLHLLHTVCSSTDFLYGGIAQEYYVPGPREMRDRLSTGPSLGCIAMSRAHYSETALSRMAELYNGRVRYEASYVFYEDPGELDPRAEWLKPSRGDAEEIMRILLSPIDLAGV